MIFFHSFVAFKKNVHLCAAKDKLGKESQKEYRFFLFTDIRICKNFLRLSFFARLTEK